MMTPELIRSIVDYDAVTGLFIWKKRGLRPGLERIDAGWNKRFAGRQVAARRHRNGHLQVGIYSRNYMAHRLAWLHFHGEGPAGDIDHANGDPADNRIMNLRIATPSQNAANAKRRADNTSGVKGVSWSRKSGKWYAYINKGGRMMAIGMFTELKDADQARQRAANDLFGEFARAV